MGTNDKNVARVLSEKMSKHIDNKDYFSDFASEDSLINYARGLFLSDMQDLVMDREIIIDHVVDACEIDFPDELKSSKRTGSIYYYNKLCTELLPKMVSEIASKAAELRQYIVDRVKAEVPVVFHQFIKVCNETTSKYYSDDRLTLSEIDSIKANIDEDIESLKYSCLFDIMGNDLAGLLKEVKDNQIDIKALQEKSPELYYLVCFEAMNKFMEIVLNKPNALKYKELTNYHLEQVMAITDKGVSATLVLEMSQDPLKLTINDTTPDVKKVMESLKLGLLKAGDGEITKFKSFLEKQTNKIRSKNGDVLSKDSTPFGDYSDLFNKEVAVHENQEVIPGTKELVSKYEIVSKKMDRKWETNSIIVDLSRHVKRALSKNEIGGEIDCHDLKFRVNIAIYSRSGLFV